MVLYDERRLNQIAPFDVEGGESDFVMLIRPNASRKSCTLKKECLTVRNICPVAVYLLE